MTIEEIERLEQGKNILQKIDDGKEFKKIIGHLFDKNLGEIDQVKIIFRLNKDKEKEKFEIVAVNKYLNSTLYVDESDFRFIINTVLHMVDDKIESYYRNFKNL